MLQISGLTKSLPGGKQLYQDLSLTLGDAQFIAITGESGTGKSTLLNLIAGLELPDSGDIVIDGVALNTLSDTERTLFRRDHLGFVFQAFHVLPHLTLAQNVALPLILQRIGVRQAHDRARDMLERTGIHNRQDSYPSELSGGEMQRVAIARALVHHPRLVLADEPTGNLDPESAARVLDLLREQVHRNGSSAILVTHSERAAQTAPQRYVLSSTGLAKA